MLKTDLLDVPSLSCRTGQGQADHVHQQTRDPQQVVSITNECRSNDVVHKEGAIVREKHTPIKKQKEKWDKSLSLEYI